MMKNFFHRILASTALCLAAVGVSCCNSPSVEEKGPVFVFSYHQNGGIDKSYYFSEDTPYPSELSEWIEYNNGKLYYATMLTYAPDGISLCFPAQKLQFSFRSDIVYDGSGYRTLTQKDREFMDWLKMLPWLSNQTPDNSPDSWLYKGTTTMPSCK